MAEALQLEIVTPEKQVVHTAAEEIIIPAKRGYIGILPGHAPLITELAVGQISYKSAGREHHLAVAWGFAEVLPGKVTILAEIAERAEEIDVARAEAARKTAEEQVRSAASEAEVVRAQDALARAQARIDVGRKRS
jgi:F-type H+-transporting ATPase subunit epsilon